MPDPPAPRPVIASLRRRRLIDAATAGMLLASLYIMGGMWRSGAMWANDIRHLWGGSRLLAAGLDPSDSQTLFRFALREGWADDEGRPVVNPYVYLPTTGLLFLPMAILPFRVAVDVWFWVNWVMAWALVLAGPSLLGVRRRELARLAGALFLAGSEPFLIQLSNGQMNVATAWLILLSAAAVRRRRDVWAGVFLAFGFAWKIAPALLILLMAPMRRWRGLAAGIAAAALLWGASFAIAGPRVQMHALQVVMQMKYGSSTWSEFGKDYYRAPSNESPHALLHRLLTANPYSEPWVDAGPRAANLLSAACAAGLAALWAAGLWRLRRTHNGDVRLFLAGSAAMLLIPSILWDHYAVQMLPAVIWIAGDDRTTRTPGHWIVLAAAWALLCLPLRGHMDWVRRGPAILMSAPRLWPILAIYIWLLFGPRMTAPSEGNPAT